MEHDIQMWNEREGENEEDYDRMDDDMEEDSEWERIVHLPQEGASSDEDVGIMVRNEREIMKGKWKKENQRKKKDTHKHLTRLERVEKRGGRTWQKMYSAGKRPD